MLCEDHTKAATGKECKNEASSEQLNVSFIPSEEAALLDKSIFWRMLPSVDARYRSLRFAPALVPQLCQKSLLWCCVGNWITKFTDMINKHFLLCKVIYNPDGFFEQFTTWVQKMTFTEELT